jgi:hypothetical protein
MARMKSAIGVYVLALAACGGGTPAPQATTEPPAAPATASPLTLTELTFYEGDFAVARLHRDGNIDANTDLEPPVWKHAGTLNRDGMVKIDGSIIGVLTEQGSMQVVWSSPAIQMPSILLSSDTLSIGERKLTIDAKGEVQGTIKRIHIDGITDAGSKRAALLLVAPAIIPLMMMFEESW